METARIEALEQKLAEYDRVVARLAATEEAVDDLNRIKEDFGMKLKDRLDLMQAEATIRSDQMMADLKSVIDGAKSKFAETDTASGDIRVGQVEV